MKQTHYILMLAVYTCLIAGGCSSRQPTAAAPTAKVTPAQLRAFLPEAINGYSPDPSAAVRDTEGLNLASASREFVGAAPGNTLGAAIFFDGDDTRSDTKRRDSVLGNDTGITIRDFPAINHAAQTTRQIMVFAGHCTVIVTGATQDDALLKSIAEKMDLPALSRLGKAE